MYESSDNSNTLDANNTVKLCRFQSEHFTDKPQLRCNRESHDGFRNLFSMQTANMYSQRGESDIFPAPDTKDCTNNMKMNSFDPAESFLANSQSAVIGFNLRQNSEPFIHQHDFTNNRFDFPKCRFSMKATKSELSIQATDWGKAKPQNSPFILDGLMTMSSIPLDDIHNDYNLQGEANYDTGYTRKLKCGSLKSESDDRLPDASLLTSRSMKTDEANVYSEQDIHETNQFLLQTIPSSLLKDCDSSAYKLSELNSSENIPLNIPLDEDGNETSVGSIHHASGTCRPCAFCNHPKKKKCNNGIYCLFCHFKHPRKHRRKRNNKQATTIYHKKPQINYRSFEKQFAGLNHHEFHSPDLCQNSNKMINRRFATVPHDDIIHQQYLNSPGFDDLNQYGGLQLLQQQFIYPERSAANVCIPMHLHLNAQI